MKIYTESSNDGTLAIDSSLRAPMQGTYIGRTPGGKIVAQKGIARPPLTDGAFAERDAVVQEASFGKNIQDAPKGRFYVLGRVGREKCVMNAQTVYFSLTDPASLILQDNTRFEDISCLNLLCPESKRKIAAGVQAALLTDSMSPWSLITQYNVPGIRGTAYGSYLVRPHYEEISYFKLLPLSAKELAKLVEEEYGTRLERGMEFMVHRDPPLPDGSSSFIAVYDGNVDWVDRPFASKFGVVLNPLDPLWKAAGGDFDGDAANVFLLSINVQPRTPVRRYSYRIARKVYESADPIEQMIEAAGDTVTDLLGPVTLGAMKLVERNLDTADVRTNAASVMQASVEAKKHAIDSDIVSDAARLLFDYVRAGDLDGTKPYITTFLNVLRRAKGEEAKAKAWNSLVDAVVQGIWNEGSDIEKALVARVLALNALYIDSDFLRTQAKPELASALRTAARSKVSQAATDEVMILTQRYTDLTAEYRETANEPDADAREGAAESVKEAMRAVRETFRFAAKTGVINNKQLDPIDVSYAMVGYAPARIAARFVSAEIFETLGVTAKEGFVNLFGTHWKSGLYKVEELVPIYSHRANYSIITDGVKEVYVTIQNRADSGNSRTLKSVRVHIRTVPETTEESPSINRF